MSLRKILAPALCSLCAVSLLVPAAFAHGCRGGYARRTATQPCAVEDCTVMGWHYHNGTAYCGHTHGDGLCDGTCAPLCPVEDCTLAGRHLHDGVIYCGANHTDGYCNGACRAAAQSTGATGATGTWGYRGGCHGGGCWRAN